MSKAHGYKAITWLFFQITETTVSGNLKSSETAKSVKFSHSRYLTDRPRQSSLQAGIVIAKRNRIMVIQVWVQSRKYSPPQDQIFLLASSLNNLAGVLYGVSGTGMFESAS